MQYIWISTTIKLKRRRTPGSSQVLQLFGKAAGEPLIFNMWPLVGEFFPPLFLMLMCSCWFSLAATGVECAGKALLECRASGLD